MDGCEYLSGQGRMELIFNLGAVMPVDELYDSYEVHEYEKRCACVRLSPVYLLLHFYSLFFIDINFGTYVTPINVGNFD